MRRAAGITDPRLGTTLEMVVCAAGWERVLPEPVLGPSVEQVRWYPPRAPYISSPTAGYLGGGVRIEVCPLALCVFRIWADVDSHLVSCCVRRPSAAKLSPVPVRPVPRVGSNIWAIWGILLSPAAVGV